MPDWILRVMLALLLPVGTVAATGYEQAVTAWRAGRVQRLTAADSWLSLIGLHFLAPGMCRVGRAPENDVVLDFNQAINPPCAFTPFATCPLPPKENRLPVAVTAGEKDYRGAHE